MNLGELLRAPGLPISLACALFLHFAPQVRWMPSELNPFVAAVGIVAAALAIILPLLDLVSKVRK